MQRKIRGAQLQRAYATFGEYRVQVRGAGTPAPTLSVIDIAPIDKYAKKHVSTLVLVHGYAGIAESWEFQLRHFMGAYRIVAPDLRGHGHSTAPRTRYDMPELVADLRAVLQCCHVARPFTLVGHSFGGAICAEYARQYPAEVERLVLLATPASFPLGIGAQIASRIPTVLYQIWWRFRPRWNAPVYVMKRMLHNNMKGWQGRPVLASIHIPTLLLVGEHDAYFPAETYAATHNTLPCVTTQSIPGAKHKLQLEQPTPTNAAIAQFISSSALSVC